MPETPHCDESGVDWDPAVEKWKVQFEFNGQQIFVGLYIDVVQAVTERRKAQAKALSKLAIELEQSVTTLAAGPVRRAYILGTTESRTQELRYKNKVARPCPSCGQLTVGKLCRRCTDLSHRKVTRPTREELESLMREFPVRRIAQKYGVHHGTVDDWARMYGLKK
jgi:predicted RNA-binding Zn-ribbon protein involved in translation (DUF1610 family)